MDLTRRSLLQAGGLTAAALVAGRPALAQERAYAPILLAGTAFGTGQYLYHPFAVPPGVSRIDVSIAKQGAAATGLGIFDPRGSHYATLERPNGFRGIYGEERSAFFVATDAASQSFVPGPVEPGEWTVVVPVFSAPQPTPYTVTVQLSSGPRGRPFRLGRDLETVLDAPGWYRGDLHAHTPESSDAFSSRTALTPRQWADTCREIGLDFLALTDHNVVSQNFSIADDAGQDVLLMAGEEMTNWFHGHATVSGIAPGEWFDWRQLPAQMLTPQALRDPRTGTIQEFLRAARASGAYISAAHPFGASLAWRFFPDAAVDPAARTDGVEVWTGPFQPDDQAAVDAWDVMNRAGQRLVANGGSDLHGVRNTNGFAAGTPTTVVHAAALSKPAVLDALRAGRSFITRRPDGVEVYLSGSLPGQRAIPGGTLYGEPTELVQLEVVVRRAAGMRLVLLRDGAPASTTALESDEQVVPISTAVGAGGFVRVEVRGAPTFLPDTPLASTLDMEALTNPIWLVAGEPPAGTVPDTTSAPAGAGPRRSADRVAVARPAPATPARAAVPGVQPAAPPPAEVTGSGALAATGPGALLPLAGAGALLAAVAMTHSEFLMRAHAGSHLDEEVTLAGQVTALSGEFTMLSRWVAGCCSQDAELAVRVVGALPDARVGDWVEVTGRAQDRHLRAHRWRRLDVAPERREG